MTVYTYVMDDMTGNNLAAKLFEITLRGSRREWNHGDIHRFLINSRQVFDINVDTEARYPSRSCIKFWMEPSHCVAATFNDLKENLRPGFAGRYDGIEHSKLNSRLANPNNPHFQLFVLFRFEIMRRDWLDYRNPRHPIGRMINIAINIALQMDERSAYETLINFFMEPQEVGTHYGQLLQR